MQRFFIPTLVLLPLLCLLPALNAPFYFDDFPVLIDYEAIRSFTSDNLRTYFGPRFIPYLTFSLNYQLGTDATWHFHLVNFALYIFNGLLVYALIGEILKRGMPHISTEKRMFAAWGGALFYLLHPVQSQVAIYIVQRSELFAAFFYFATLRYYFVARDCYLAGFRSGKKGAEGNIALFFRPAHLRHYGVMLLLMGCAFLSKEVSATLPVALFLLEALFYSRAFFRSFAYFSPLALFLLPVPFLFFSQYGIVISGFSVSEYMAPSLPVYLLTELHVVFTYLRLLVFPVGLHLDYDYPAVTAFGWSEGGLAFLLFLLIGAGFASVRRSPVRSFGIFFFFLALLPSSSFVPISDFIYEHRLYLSMFGVALLVSLLLLRLPEKKSVYGAACILLFCFGALFLQRSFLWSDQEAFWENNISLAPHKARSYSNLSEVYQRHGKVEKSFALLNRGLKLNPRDPVFYSLLGVLYQKEGSLNKATDAYERAVEIIEGYKDIHYFSWFGYRSLSDIYYNLSSIKMRAGKYQEAEELCRKALQMKGNNRHLLYNNIGTARMMQGDFPAALMFFRKATEADENYVDPLINRGILLRNLKRYDESIQVIEKAVQIAPDNPLITFQAGESYLFKGDFPKAMEFFARTYSLGFRDRRFIKDFFLLSDRVKNKEWVLRLSADIRRGLP